MTSKLCMIVRQSGHQNISSNLKYQAFLSDMFCIMQQTLQFSGDLYGIIIYAQWFRLLFYKSMFWLEVIAQNPWKLLRVFFQTLIVICVWMPTQINLKLPGHPKGVKIYSRKYGFCKYCSSLKVCVYSIFRFWSAK